METRTTAGAVALRPSATAAGGTMIVGMIPFNSRSGTIRSSGGSFIETIAPGAFNRSLRAGGDVVGLREHDASQLLGRTKAGTLRLSVVTRGLRYEIDPPVGVSYSDDLLLLLERGDIGESSFSFRVVNDGDSWSYSDSGLPLRTLTDVDLHDVSVVLNGAYPASTASLSHQGAAPMPMAMSGRSSAGADLAEARRNLNARINLAHRRQLHMLRAH